MLKIIGIAVVVLVVGLLIYAATRPDAFRIERAASIKAPPEKIFAQVNGLVGVVALESVPASRITIKLDFIKPFEGLKRAAV